MSARAELRDGVVVVHVTGDVDVATVADLQVRVAGLIGGAPAAVVDLTGVGFLDSSGMRLLDHLVEEAAQRGTVLRVVVPPDGQIRYVLRLCAFPEELMTPDLTTALAAVTSPS